MLRCANGAVVYSGAGELKNHAFDLYASLRQQAVRLLQLVIIMVHTSLQ